MRDKKKSLNTIKEEFADVLNKYAIDDQLTKGIRVEEEHSDVIKFIKDILAETGALPSDKEIYEMIAKGHIKENKR